jgi:hypothetical protein
MLSNHKNAAMAARLGCLACGAVFALGACDPLVNDPVAGGDSGGGGSTTQSASVVTTSGATATSGGSSSTNPTSSTSAASQSTGATSTSSSSSGGGTNLIAGFAWDLVTGGMGGTVTSMTNGGACVSANAGAQVILAWPQPSSSPGIALSSGNGYTFSYTANASQQGVTVDAKVGQTMTPYTADVESKTDAVGTSMTNFSHAISGSTDSSAGIAFTFTSAVAQTVCFENVSIVQN